MDAAAKNVRPRLPSSARAEEGGEQASITEIPGSPTLFTATFVLGMNKAKYAALPADLKAILDANFGQVAAFMAWIRQVKERNLDGRS